MAVRNYMMKTLWRSSSDDGSNMDVWTPTARPSWHHPHEPVTGVSPVYVGEWTQCPAVRACFDSKNRLFIQTSSEIIRFSSDYSMDGHICWVQLACGRYGFILDRAPLCDGALIVDDSKANSGVYIVYTAAQVSM